MKVHTVGELVELLKKLPQDMSVAHVAKVDKGWYSTNLALDLHEVSRDEDSLDFKSAEDHVFREDMLKWYLDGGR